MADGALAADVNRSCRLTGSFTLRSGQQATEYFDKYRFEADPALLRRVAEAPGSLGQLTEADIEPAGVGANEVRTWIAAIAAGNLPMETVVYEPVREWITGMAIAASR